MSQEADLGPVDGDGHRHHVPLTPFRNDGVLAGLLQHRRSTRSYHPHRLDLGTLNRLLSVTLGAAPDARRPYGSAHGRYDIAVTVIAAAVDGLASAAYRYLPAEHSLVCIEEGDHRFRLAEGTIDADRLTDSPAVLLLSADIPAANDTFEGQGPGRGERFCWFEAGLIAQNIYLWSAENALGTVFLGGLDSARMRVAAQGLLPPSHTVLGLLPIGRPADATLR